MVDALLLQPIYDEATELQAEYLRILEPKLREINPNIEIKYGDINEKNVEYWIAKYNPKFIYFGGHGFYDGILGARDYIIRFGYNDFILRGRGVYLYECDSASTLGKFTYARAVIGYTKPYYVYSDITLFVGYLPLIYILAGYTFRYAYNMTKLYYKKLIPLVSDELTKEVLIHNMNALSIYGDTGFHI